MANLIERIEADYKAAMKAKEQLRVDTLRLAKAAIQHAAIEKRKEGLEDKDVIQVLTKQAKQRRETIESAKDTSRQDIFKQATEELAILSGYLPKALSDDDLNRLVQEAMEAVGANQGQIMKYVMGKAGGAADGKRVSQLVGEKLKKGQS